MGTADLVPGISGGTVAFMMGFYDQLLQSIKTFNRSSCKLFFLGQWRAFFQTVAWKFLLSLLIGISFSFAILASFFHHILGHEIYRAYLYSFFMGLILASFLFCIRQVQKWNGLSIAGLLLGAIGAYLLTGAIGVSDSQGEYAIKIQLDHAMPPLKNYDPQQKLLTQLSEASLGALLTKGIVKPDTLVYDIQGKPIGLISDFAISYKAYPIDLWIVFCGALAICALLLPGISGSYLLTLMGVYPVIMRALADFIQGIRVASFDREAFYILLSLAIGILGGALLFARFVSWLLKYYSNMTLAVLSGFMIGALRSVWPFWSYAYALLPLKLDKGPQLLVVDPIWPSISTPFSCAVLLGLGGFSLIYSFQLKAGISAASSTIKDEPI